MTTIGHVGHGHGHDDVQGIITRSIHQWQVARTSIQVMKAGKLVGGSLAVQPGQDRQAEKITVYAQPPPWA